MLGALDFVKREEREDEAMLKTRFDERKMWNGAGGKQYEIAEMTMAHLMNTLKMFDEKAFRTVRMILDDIERSTVFIYGRGANDKKESIRNATSMSESELKDFALNSPLANAMKDELIYRGVNVDNIMNLTAGGNFDNFNLGGG